jgi:hypothetical protein
VESKLGPLGTSATEWPIVPSPGDYDEGESGDHVRYNHLNYVAPWSQLCVNTVQFQLNLNDNLLPRCYFNFSACLLLFFSLYELGILACSNPELTSEIMNHTDSLCVCLSVYLSIYGFTALVDLGRFFSFLIYTQSVGLLGRGISPSQGRYMYTGQHKHGINAHRHAYLEWDSNPRSQCSSWRRQFMP